MPAQDQGRHERSQVHMGVRVRVVVEMGDGLHPVPFESAFARIAALDAAMSDYRPESEVSRIGDRAGHWQEVSADVFAVLARAREIAAATGGAFDPTVAPVVALWRTARRTNTLPGAAALAAARALVDWRALELDAARRAVRLARPGMRLDLGGIAKGYILQQGFEELARRGAPRALLEAGGDIVVGDAPRGQRGWSVETPGASPAFTARAAALARAALATSGPSAQFVEIDGVRYSHVVDPATGLGLTHATTAYVIAADGATADAYATAFTVRPDLGWGQVLDRSIVRNPITIPLIRPLR